MASKKKATAASAPASQKSVRKRNSKKAGIPTRAEKSAINKAINASASQLARATIEAQKREGRTAAGKSIADIIGKPVEWCDPLSVALFALISTGHGMTEIASIDGMPPLYQMLQWLGDEAHPFVSVYTRAKQMLVPLYEEKAQELAMNSNAFELRTEKQVVTKDGDIVDVVETRYVDNVERSRLAVATMQWTLSHLRPRKHGRDPIDPAPGANEQLKGLIDALKAGPVE
jgi:hypothetical protein